MRNLAEWILRALILLVTASIVPGFTIDSFAISLLVALVLGILNILVKPFLTLLALPLTLLTLGLFTFVINAFLLILAAQIVPGFHIDSLLTAIVASIIIAILSTLVNALFGK